MGITSNLPGPDSIFRRIGATEASHALAHLLQQVSGGFGRIEIVGAEEGCVCVLLSKTELDCLERALSILSGTKGAEQMSAQLQAIATAARASVAVRAHVS